MSDLAFLDGVDSSTPAASDEVIAEALEARELGRKILPRYFAEYRGDFQAFRVLFAEKVFVRPLLRRPGPQGKKNPPNRFFRHGGKVDLALERIEDGKIFGVDHKFFAPGSWSEESNLLRLDDQITGYFDASREILADSSVLPLEKNPSGSRTFDGFVYNVALKRVPSEPEILKSGKLSVAKNSSTSPELFRAAVTKLALTSVLSAEDSTKYEDYLLHLEANRRTYFARSTVIRTDDQIAEWRDRNWRLVTEDRTGLVYKNPNFMVCPRCPFKGICEFESPEGLENFVVDPQNVPEELRSSGVESVKPLWTYSRASSFSQCRLAHHYRYHKGLKPRIRATYFRDGDLLHGGLARWYESNGNDDQALVAFETGWKEELERIKGPDAGIVLPGGALGF